MMPLRFKAREWNEKGYLMDCGFPCRVCFRFLRDESAKCVLEFFMRILVFCFVMLKSIIKRHLLIYS